MTISHAVNWETDESGRLVGVSTHDAKIVDLQFRSDAVVCSLKNLSSELVRMEFAGTRNFHVLSFGPDAIVADIFVWPVRDVPGQLWQISDSAWNTLFAGLSQNDAKLLAHKLTTERPDALLAQVLCSANENFVVVCDEVKISKGVDEI